MPSKRSRPARRPAASRGASGTLKKKQGKKKRASGANATAMAEYKKTYPKRNAYNPPRKGRGAAYDPTK